MRQITFSITISGSMLLAVCGITQAAPIAPLLSGAANITPVYYHYRHHYGRHHHWLYGYGSTAHNWDWYRVDRPGRGVTVEGTR
jgi:hypothetical protein